MMFSPKLTQFSRKCHFSKIWPAGGSTLARPLLERSISFCQHWQNSQGSAIFEKSDPPEAAPLLDPCLKVTKKLPNLSKVSRNCNSSKIWPAGGGTPARPLLESHTKIRQNWQNLKEEPFWIPKIWPTGGSTLARPLLERSNIFRQNWQISQGSAIFQKSDPPEAAPLLEPCFKGPKNSPKLTKFSRKCNFSKIWPAGGSNPARPLLQRH